MDNNTAPEPFSSDRFDKLREEIDKKLDKKLDNKPVAWVAGVFTVMVIPLVCFIFYSLSNSVAKLTDKVDSISIKQATLDTKIDDLSKK